MKWGGPLTAGESRVRRLFLVSVSCTLTGRDWPTCGKKGLSTALPPLSPGTLVHSLTPSWSANDFLSCPNSFQFEVGEFCH